MFVNFNQLSLINDIKAPVFRYLDSIGNDFNGDAFVILELTKASMCFWCGGDCECSIMNG